jgi:hypothetical protein
VLAAHAASRGRSGAGEALESLLRTFAEWPWPEPVALAGPVALAPHDRLPVLSLIAPRVNSARNVTRATREVLVAELARAADLVARVRSGRAAWDALFEPWRAEGAALRLRLEASDAVSRASAEGWLEGQALSLVLALEGAARGVRPDPRPTRASDGRATEWRISLNEPDARSVQRAADAFAERFAASHAHDLRLTLELAR